MLFNFLFNHLKQRSQHDELSRYIIKNKQFKDGSKYYLIEFPHTVDEEENHEDNVVYLNEHITVPNFYDEDDSQTESSKYFSLWHYTATVKINRHGNYVYRSIHYYFNSRGTLILSSFIDPAEGSQIFNLSDGTIPSSITMSIRERMLSRTKNFRKMVSRFVLDEFQKTRAIYENTCVQLDD